MPHEGLETATLAPLAQTLTQLTKRYTEKTTASPFLQSRNRTGARDGRRETGPHFYRFETERGSGAAVRTGGSGKF